MVTDFERALMKKETCDSSDAVYTGGRLQAVESHGVAAPLSVNGKQQCTSAVRLNSNSAFSDATDVCSAPVQCKWYRCGCEIASDVLLEHIRIKHVATQLRFSNHDEEQSFVCLWNGCKVYNRPSCLLTWLERHIVSHLGDKPYCCIVAGCGGRFASQIMLERHVNGHFAGTCSTSLTVSRSLRKSESVFKLTRKRKPQSARPYPG